MLGRLLSAIAVTFVACGAAPSASVAPSPFSHAELGKCFTDADAFVRSALGEAAPSDPNITKSNNGAWTWIVDQTATKNYTWYLLEAKSSEVCFRVFVPAASHVEFKTKRGITLVEAVIAPEADFPAKLVELQPDAGSLAFSPTRCYLLTGGQNVRTQKRQPVSCERIFD